MIAVIIIVATVVVALFVLGGAAWFAYDSDKRVRTFARSTDLIPGRPGRAPESWTTDNSREALLHRRIRYAIADVHANPAIPLDEELVAARNRLDDAVFELDDRLIASVDRGADEAAEVLDHAESAVKDLEKLPKKLWEAPKDEQIADLDRVTRALSRG
ncbi:hypothetical protein IA539_05355 [Gordonia sp. zg691]|uniref:Uncharacterized protein n=1 Tax=Gordonia jinghuaiqii TaxID=2758710 RepID=A0A7D7LW80_9ACTN|nr:hypothetical protein [Gordonia jinghuaiqii]MBD0860634.1 hypothetical protein [Gordonia jinghuaiqii]MCR5978100.1 hypothetical protein [Gordonia jinghuaiqii]QMT01439.1 hypothetical protein H1R19_21910 [Gordonia jinghuaiqii]